VFFGFIVIGFLLVLSLFALPKPVNYFPSDSSSKAIVTLKFNDKDSSKIFSSYIEKEKLFSKNSNKLNFSSKTNGPENIEIECEISCNKIIKALEENNHT
jgi:hypothetical protein